MQRYKIQVRCIVTATPHQGRNSGLTISCFYFPLHTRTLRLMTSEALRAGQAFLNPFHRSGAHVGQICALVCVSDSAPGRSQTRTGCGSVSQECLRGVSGLCCAMRGGACLTDCCCGGRIMSGEKPFSGLASASAAAHPSDPHPRGHRRH